ncbi:DUF1000-domain-containing protein [Flagelloscypha sp. PMI_526]|nr:DUF1000-domain-containing protein [Flagelloscypha sp. PMI_526]
MAASSSHNESDLISSDFDETTLYSVIDRSNVHGLNLTVPESARSLIKPWDKRDDEDVWVESGVDDQMIIQIPFIQNIRLKSIIIKAGRGDLAPRNLRLYTNKPTIPDFDDIPNMKAQLDIALLENGIGVTEYPLRVAAFASVNSLSVFLGDSPGGDQSRVYYIGFKGDLRNPKKEAGEMLDIRAENAAGADIVDRVKDRATGTQDVAR